MALEKFDTNLLTIVGGAERPDNWNIYLEKDIERIFKSDPTVPKLKLIEITESIFRAWNINAKEVKITKSYEHSYTSGSDQKEKRFKVEIAAPIYGTLSTKGFKTLRWNQSFSETNMTLGQTNENLRMSLYDGVKYLGETSTGFFGNSKPSFDMFTQRSGKSKLKFYALCTLLSVYNNEYLSPVRARVAVLATTLLGGIKVVDETLELTEKHFITGQTFNTTHTQGSSIIDDDNRHRGLIKYEITDTFY